MKTYTEKEENLIVNLRRRGKTFPKIANRMGITPVEAHRIYFEHRRKNNPRWTDGLTQRTANALNNHYSTREEFVLAFGTGKNFRERNLGPVRLAEIRLWMKAL